MYRLNKLYAIFNSTISSNLNSMATITLEDFIKPRLVNLSDAKATIMSKWLCNSNFIFLK